MKSACSRLNYWRLTERKEASNRQNLLGGHSAVVPPDPMPNSEVKRRSADGSVGSPHVRVGNCQALNKTRKPTHWVGFFAFILFHLR